MWTFLENLFSPSQYIPHGHCDLWQPQLVWLHLLSDLLIAIAYFSIPAMFLYFVYKRSDVSLSKVFVLFSAFILLCGTGHLLDIWTLWHPAYWLTGIEHAMTALVSCYTAVKLVELLPKFLALRTPEQLETINQELHRAYDQMEQRVQERTAALVIANTTLEAEISGRIAAEVALRQQAEQEHLMSGMAQRIRQSLDLQHILSTTVSEVRQFLQADRVLTYRVNPGGTGMITNEAVAPGHSPLLDQPLPREMFPIECYELYRQGRVGAITDVEKGNLPHCLVETLRQIGVQSKLVVPILHKEELWGLLIAHQCSQPRQWQLWETELLKQLSTQVAIALRQSELFGQVQQLNSVLEEQVAERTVQLEQALALEATLKRLTDKVRDSLDERQILQTAVDELAQTLGVLCCDTALYNADRTISTIYCESTTLAASACGKTIAMGDFPERYGSLIQGNWLLFCSIPACACRQDSDQTVTLACPIVDDQGVLGDLWLFRQWQETFTELEIRLVQQVANQCAIALRQAGLYHAAQTQVEELGRLNYLKDDFLSTVSHELRTPLSSIKMATEMISISLRHVDELQDPTHAVFRYLRILQDEGQREANLIDDLLDLSLLEAGTDPLNLIDISLPLWLPHITESFAERASMHQQAFTIEVAAELPFIRTDVPCLEKILSELLHNACKYTPAQEKIILRGQIVDDRLLLQVTNTGTDIPEHELAHVFDKFHRVPNNDPWKYGGTGLGLALVKKRVEHLGGTIEVSSGSGQTTFALHLPR